MLKIRNTDKINKRYNKIVIVGFVFFWLTIMVVIMSPLGSRYSLWNFESAVMLLNFSAYLGFISLLISLCAITISRPGQAYRGFYLSLLAFITIIAMLLFLFSWKESKENLPPIQDITTNTEKPPQFWTAPNSRVYGGHPIAAYQLEAYPDIQPLIVSDKPDTIFDAVLTVIKQKHWTLWESNREEKHIEATEVTFWFGFSDDVVIHISTTENGSSRVDVRSTSRFGSGGDGGTNARRIRTFMASLKKQLNE